MNRINISQWASALALGVFVLQNNSARGDAAPPPAPALVQLQPVKATGLRITPRYEYGYGGGYAGDYGVCTAKKTGYSWVTLAKPVLYSMDIADWTTANASLLLLASRQPVGVPSQATNTLALNVSQLTNGSGFAQLLLTLDQSTQILASLTAPSPVGSWSVALQGNQANLRGPSGVSTACEIDTNLLGVFADPLFVYCFAPQQSWGWGRWWPGFNYGPGPPDVTIGRIQILGVPEPIDEQFSTTTLNTNLWQVPCPADANRNMLPIPKGTRLYLSWPWDYYHGPHVLVNSTPGLDLWQDLGEATNVLYCCSYCYLPLAPEVTGNRFFRVRWDYVDWVVGEGLQGHGQPLLPRALGLRPW